MFRVVLSADVHPLPGDKRFHRVIVDHEDCGQALAKALCELMDRAGEDGPFIGDGPRLVITLEAGVVAWEG